MTLDERGEVVRFNGLLIAPDGKVVKLLKRGDKRPEKLDWKEDLRGRTLIPGMVDAHGHVMDLGFRAMTLDLSRTTSLTQAQDAIRRYTAENAHRPWIVGGGWNQEVWQLGRFPTAAELDAATGDKPAWFVRADGHAGWANSAAMRAAGITAATKAPAGGRIEQAAGRPGGVFVDAAMALIEKSLPKPTP
ncbi:MAG: amidohydrolase family protein, partial [Sphingomonas sp.]